MGRCVPPLPQPNPHPVTQPWGGPRHVPRRWGVGRALRGHRAASPRGAQRWHRGVGGHRGAVLSPLPPRSPGTTWGSAPIGRGPLGQGWGTDGESRASRASQIRFGHRDALLSGCVGTLRHGDAQEPPAAPRPPLSSRSRISPRTPLLCRRSPQTPPRSGSGTPGAIGGYREGTTRGPPAPRPAPAAPHPPPAPPGWRCAPRAARGRSFGPRRGGRRRRAPPGPWPFSTGGIGGRPPGAPNPALSVRRCPALCGAVRSAADGAGRHGPPRPPRPPPSTGAPSHPPPAPPRPAAAAAPEGQNGTGKLRHGEGGWGGPAVRTGIGKREVGGGREERDGNGEGEGDRMGTGWAQERERDEDGDGEGVMWGKGWERGWGKG